MRENCDLCGVGGGYAWYGFMRVVEFMDFWGGYAFLGGVYAGLGRCVEFLLLYRGDVDRAEWF